MRVLPAPIDALNTPAMEDGYCPRRDSGAEQAWIAKVTEANDVPNASHLTNGTARQRQRSDVTLNSLSLNHLAVDTSEGVAVVTLDCGPLGVLDYALVEELSRLVGAAHADPSVRAVVFTGAHPSRFISHADIRMLQEGGRHLPRMSRRTLSLFVRIASALRKSSRFERWAHRTPLAGAFKLDRFHDTLLRMNASGVVFVAALNGSALGVGAEFAWACDVRVMTDDDDCFIGQPEVLLGFNPGGGGTQRLSRLIGGHRALIAMLEGRPLTPPQALDAGAIDELAPPGDVVLRAVSWARDLGSRPKDAIEAIKRSVYFGGSMELSDGLRTERAEFMNTLGSDRAQSIMNTYMRTTETAGELPLYDSATYERALRTGQLPNSTSPTTKVARGG